MVGECVDTHTHMHFTCLLFTVSKKCAFLNDSSSLGSWQNHCLDLTKQFYCQRLTKPQRRLPAENPNIWRCHVCKVKKNIPWTPTLVIILTQPVKAAVQLL